MPRGLVVRRCNVALQRLSPSTLNQHNVVLRQSAARRRRLSGKQLLLQQRKGSTGGAGGGGGLGGDGIDPGDGLMLGTSSRLFTPGTQTLRLCAVSAERPLMCATQEVSTGYCIVDVFWSRVL